MLKKVIDQLNNTVEFNYPPKRIVSLVPSQTELLFELGLGDRVVGITKFCRHPADRFKTTQKVGGTKSVDIEKVASLGPDLIIGNKEENDRSQITELSEKYSVWMSDIYTLDDAYSMISEIGKLTSKEQVSSELLSKIKTGFSYFHSSKVTLPRLKVAYLIWKDPFMAAGKNTFIDNMIKEIGLENAFSERRYPQTDLSDLIKRKPDLVFLSSEPYPFRRKHVDDLHNYLPAAKIMLVDGEMFSWYGSRLKHSPVYFRTLLESINKNY